MDGADGLLSAYLDAVSKVKLYGPTNFADVINRTALMAKVVFFSTAGTWHRSNDPV